MVAAVRQVPVRVGQTFGNKPRSPPRISCRLSPSQMNMSVILLDSLEPLPTHQYLPTQMAPRHNLLDILPPILRVWAAPETIIVRLRNSRIKTHGMRQIISSLLGNHRRNLLLLLAETLPKVEEVLILAVITWKVYRIPRTQPLHPCKHCEFLIQTSYLIRVDLVAPPLPAPIWKELFQAILQPVEAPNHHYLLPLPTLPARNLQWVHHLLEMTSLRLLVCRVLAIDSTCYILHVVVAAAQYNTRCFPPCDCSVCRGGGGP
jgi:hypothetical protein